MDVEPIVLVHGGAGDIPNSRVPGKLRGVRLAAQLGYMKLKETGNVMDAAEEAVRSMELDQYFNAGYGAVLTSDGTVEMDAAIMEGKTVKAGCASGVKDILHPISVARRVMITPHNFLSGIGVNNFVKEQGFEILKPGDLVTDYARESLEEWRNGDRMKLGRYELGRRFEKNEVGTVGAVVIDRDGNVAAATSTGGMTGKMPGRIGDSPILGAGTYADNSLGAVSATGTGESIMKAVLAYDILLRAKSIGIDNACQFSCESMTERFVGDGGVIALDPQGKVGIAFTSERMAWAYQKNDTLYYGIEKGDFFEQPVVASSTKSSKKNDVQPCCHCFQKK